MLLEVIRKGPFLRKLRRMSCFSRFKYPDSPRYYDVTIWVVCCWDEVVALSQQVESKSFTCWFPCVTSHLILLPFRCLIKLFIQQVADSAISTILVFLICWVGFSFWFWLSLMALSFPLSSVCWSSQMSFIKFTYLHASDVCLAELFWYPEVMGSV